MTATDEFPLPPPSERRFGWWATVAKYALGLAPFIVVWVVLVVWLSMLLMSKATWTDETDEATMREWLEETRPFRRTLPELIREYLEISDRAGSEAESPEKLEFKRSELVEQLKALAEPTRAYESKLPAFPVVYRLEVRIAGSDGAIAWENPIPRPRQQNRTRVRQLRFAPLGSDRRADVICEYSLHAFNKLQQREQDGRRIGLVAQAVLVVATLIAGAFVYRFLRRELRRENERLKQMAAAETREAELLKTRLKQREAEHARDELDRMLLRQQLDAATLKERADEAEKDALQLKSQLYAGIGIMAGSYAHNIKNLLVRPNDLLVRCAEDAGASDSQRSLLREVQSTLGTVTERLQQILKTVRRDPNRSEWTEVDLAGLIRETGRTWLDLAREKWKVQLSAFAPDSALPIRGDLSHLQQAIENLLFNSRDATFEMRNHLRDLARQAPAEARKQKLLEAAAWKGHVDLEAKRDGRFAVLEVRDNGIGMTADVRSRCLETHFTTKRDNALYEGYSAGMGLGLSFVAMVFDHHDATLEIESSPLQGACFRIRFPLIERGE